MKKTLSIVLILSLLFGSTIMTKAAPERFSVIEYLNDGSYYITTIQVTSNDSLISAYAAASKRSGSKTVTYSSSSGVDLWSVTVNGSFSYVKGSRVSCTSSSVSAATYSSSWKVGNKSSSRSGNKASASATGTQYKGSAEIGSITKSITLTCDTNGNLS